MNEIDYFSKSFFKKCVQVEVYKNKRIGFFEKLWMKYFKPETNSVYLIRKYLYKLHRTHRSISALFLRIKLLKKYNIHVSSETRIGLGLDIRHPSAIMITNAQIGKNCVLFHNVTIGAKHETAGIDDSPTIGDNVVFYSNSACYGAIAICNNVFLGSFCCVIKDITESGTYIGIGTI